MAHRTRQSIYNNVLHNIHFTCISTNGNSLKAKHYTKILLKLYAYQCSAALERHIDVKSTSVPTTMDMLRFHSPILDSDQSIISLA